MSIYSIKKQKEFEYINAKGKRFSNPYFLLIIVNSVVPGDFNLFLGLKVSKKLGIAVKRNKIKRRIRHLVRIIVQEFKGIKNKNIFIVFIPKKSFYDAEFSIILMELRKILTPLF